MSINIKPTSTTTPKNELEGTAKSACCSPKERESCCEASAKAQCCGTPNPGLSPPTSCGCR